MNTTMQTSHEPAREWNVTRTAGTATEAIGAIAVVVLAIIGLAGLFSSLLASIATIVLGAAILLEGVTTDSTYAKTTGGVHFAMFSGAFTTETLGGVAGIVLGILALFGGYSQTFLAVALIVFGATFLIDRI